MIPIIDWRNFRSRREQIQREFWAVSSIYYTFLPNYHDYVLKKLCEKHRAEATSSTEAQQDG
jgi:hypothetical protein